MNFDSTSIIINVFAGIVGMAYIVYGKKQQRLVPMLSGFALCLVPFFIESNTVLIAVCVGLVIAPFFIRIEL